jgi:uncharacterized protein (TIGR02466 family)
MINYYYPTPVYHGYVQPAVRDTIQNDLQKVVDDMKSTNKFKKNPNWADDTHSLSDPTFDANFIDDYELETFYEEIRFHVNSYMKDIGAYHVKFFKITQSWITLTNKDEYAILHTHGNSDLSGVYYFKTNSKDGNIYFRSPNRFIANSHAFHHAPDQIETNPEVGKFILFPGWLDHGVLANNTDHERISISFNISFGTVNFDKEKDKL